MENIIDQFIGRDPILGHQAMEKLIEHGDKSLDHVIIRFGSLNRTSSMLIRLSQLFEHFGDASVDRLMSVFETKNWHKMTDASYCFSNLNQVPAAYKLIQLLESTSDIDVKRCVIDSLGYLGATDWDFKILQLFPLDPQVVIDAGLGKNFAHGYFWDKLSYNAFLALFRIASKEDKAKDVWARLNSIEHFHQIAGDEGFNRLYSRTWFDLDQIYYDFKAVAADSLIRNWLKHDNPVFKRFAAKILGSMRLNRAVISFKSFVESDNEDIETKQIIAYALSEIHSKEAAEVLKNIFLTTTSSAINYKQTCLCMAICLDKLEDIKFIEEIYPTLLKLKGEVEAHTYYNLGLLGFEEDIWSNAINSEDYITRASVAPIYARLKGSKSIPKLLQMYRESSEDIERLLIVSSLIISGHTLKSNLIRKILTNVSKSSNLKMIRYTWKREIIIALKIVEDIKTLAVWENLLGIDSQVAADELSTIIGKNTLNINHSIPQKPVNEISSGKKPVKIFISYAHKDEKWKDKLKSHLSPLRNQGFLIDWDDREIEAGTWTDQIENAMEKTDIFLLLITNNFLSSSYITSKEITKAYLQYKVGKSKIFPIICDACAWQLQPITMTEKELHPTKNKEMFVWLGKFQPFPKDGKPIKNWSNQQNAFTDVINQLEKYL